MAEGGKPKPENELRPFILGALLIAFIYLAYQMGWLDQLGKWLDDLGNPY